MANINVLNKYAYKVNNLYKSHGASNVTVTHGANLGKVDFLWYTVQRMYAQNSY
jgi:hypothetical protein